MDGDGVHSDRSSLEAFPNRFAKEMASEKGVTEDWHSCTFVSGTIRAVKSCAPVPGDLSSCFEEFAGAGWVEKGCAHDLGGTFFDRLRTAVCVQVGGCVTRVDRVYGDVSIAELVGQLDGEHIERGLRGAIGKHFHRCD